MRSQLRYESGKPQGTRYRQLTLLPKEISKALPTLGY
jgi:hypothetical protein